MGVPPEKTIEEYAKENQPPATPVAPAEVSDPTDEAPTPVPAISAEPTAPAGVPADAAVAPDHNS